jgi:hypothetical protein
MDGTLDTNKCLAGCWIAIAEAGILRGKKTTAQRFSQKMIVVGRKE